MSIRLRGFITLACGLALFIAVVSYFILAERSPPLLIIMTPPCIFAVGAIEFVSGVHISKLRTKSQTGDRTDKVHVIVFSAAIVIGCTIVLGLTWLGVGLLLTMP